MSVTVVRDVEGQNGASATTWGPGNNGMATVTATQAGNMPAIVVCFSGSNGNVINTVADNKSNSWAKAKSVNPGASKLACEIWYVDPATAIAGITTVTVTFSVTATADGRFFEASGIANAPHDSTGGAVNNGSSTTPTVTGGTLAQADEWVLACCGYATTGTITLDTSHGWTNDAKTINSGTNKTDQQVSYQETAATTALTHAPTLGTTGNWVEVMAAFKVAGGVVVNSNMLMAI